MTNSQKIARFFEIVNYFMLVPAAFGIFMSFLLIGGAPWFTAIILAISAVGMALLVGYFKHSRGRLAESKVKALWIGTIAYNGLFLLPTIYVVLSMAIDEGNRFSRNFSEPYFLLGVAIFVWWILAIAGSGLALKSDLSNQKYR
jgi:hypothetical protein